MKISKLEIVLCISLAAVPPQYGFCLVYFNLTF